ncbi:maltase A2-like [Bactrocera dorsalis]|uniref:alpha-glucosidase n=1 Tax=Bactrocera dorsalis TaxID=27457 RepID=A0A6I9V3M3_BACDO|nr:maltase A2-like [Bactrocera dorsalis]
MTQTVFVAMSSGTLRIVQILLLCACGAFAASDVDWWESATLYQIYPRSFMDSDGDGVGDLNGITSRLPFLKEIGVTATWLSPIYESPMADMGYDIINFTKIEPLFGTMEDFDAMVAKAHELGLKIILDFVPNHSSDECEWFQKSIRREDGYDDFYIWDDGKIDPQTGERVPPSNWNSEFNGPAWTWNEQRQQYYFHWFLSKQPDFNLRSPMVHQHLIEIMKFWLERGVDAFRIDAVPHFFEKRFDNGTYPDEPPSGMTNDTNSNRYYDHIYTKDQPENPTILYEWREFLDEYQRQHGGDTRAMVAEAYASVNILSDYINNGTHVGTQLPMNFNFVFLRNTASARMVQLLADNWMNVMWTKHKVANWVVGNHDNSRPATRIGEQRADMMTIIAHAMPGTSVTYYGDEIGMTDYDAECTWASCDFRDPERTPMQWDSTTNAGFSKGNSTWLPVNSNYKTLNVQRQRGIARSTLNIYKAMTALKKTIAFKSFKEEGGFSYEALSEQVFQIIRTAPNIEEYRVLANFGGQMEYLDGLTNKTMEYVVLNSYSPHRYGDKVDLSKRIYLMPYEAVVLRWVA